MCLYETCSVNGGSYNYIGLPGKYCKKHFLDGMINVKHPRCEQCSLQASYGYREGNRRLRCRMHREQDMTYLKLIKCSVENCNRQIPTHKEKHMCMKCYILHNRTSTQAIFCYNPTERDIAFHLQDAFPHLFLYWNYKIDLYTCNYVPDFRFDCGDWHVIIELDEDNHRYYNKYDEETRIENIRITIGKPLYVIRFGHLRNSVLTKEKVDQLLKCVMDCISEKCIPDTYRIIYLY
jgi:very-short-patch-repair endonuclease